MALDFFPLTWINECLFYLCLKIFGFFQRDKDLSKDEKKSTINLKLVNIWNSKDYVPVLDSMLIIHWELYIWIIY